MGIGGASVMHQFSGILLEVQALDTHDAGPAVWHVDPKLARPHDGMPVLRDLVALRQIRIEVVLAVKHRKPVDLGPKR